MSRRSVLLFLLFICFCCSGFAAVKSVRTNDRTDVLGGKRFGASGAYERVTGRVHFTIDPKAPASKVITDIELAPRNEDGSVEFSADFYVLKPTEPKLGNGTVLFEVSNRGGKGMVGMFSDSPSTRDPREEKDFGDAFLLERGYTLVWLGWQFDVPHQPDLLRLFSPVPAENGQPILGVVRSEHIPDGPSEGFSLADRNHLPYLVADPADPDAQMTVRDRCEGVRRVIPRAQWKFNGDRGGVTVEGGLTPGKIYEVVYKAKDPALVGLGPTGIRDFLSYLKYGTAAAGINSLGDFKYKRVVGFGTSQSGRFLRAFLYNGFNADEEGRKVFDGVWAHVAGGGRGSFNHRFAQASRDGHPHMNCSYPTDIFPFTDLPETDPETGLTAGLLDKAQLAAVVPKVFYTNGSYEYWGRSAGLIHSSLDGKQDALMSPSTRAYLLAGTQHGPGAFPPRQGAAEYVSNGNDYRWHMRALLVAMNEWLTSGKEPPASQVPQVGKDQLVPVGAVNWPKIPGVKLPTRPQRAWRADYGPDFRAKGIVTQEPPKLGNAFAALVPQVDMDGNETSGIRHPMLVAPLGTYTGWNMRKASQGATDELYSMVGSTFFFAKTKTERLKTGDPRPSLAERYKNKQEYLDKFTAAAKQLAKDGYLLETDLEMVIRRGSWFWDHLMAGAK
jgi:hypothetical protein